MLGARKQISSKHLFSCLLTAAGLSLATLASAQWVSFNDHVPGTFGPAGQAGTQTGNGVTTYGAFTTTGNSGPLTNILTGEQITYNGQPVTVTILTNGTSGGNVSSGSQAGVPASGTPLANTFDGYVYFGNGTATAIQTRPNSWCIYVFTNLDPSARYIFKGGAVRGGAASDTNRWSMYELQGVDSAIAAHEQGSTSPWGIMTPERVPSSLSGYQVAIQSGVNTNGDMAAWTEINPGADGGFTVYCTAYRGTVATGYGTDPTTCTTGGSYGYAISGFRLEQVTGGGILSATITPGDQTVVQCSTVTYRANVSGGTAPYTYQWYLNDTGTPVNGATTSTLTLSNVQPSDAGSYFVIVTDSTSGGGQMAPSTPATLAVNLNNTPAVLLSAISSTNLHTVTVSFSKAVSISSATGGDFLARPVSGSGDISFTSAVVTNGTNVILTTADPLQRKNYNLMIQGTGVRDTCLNSSIADGSSVRLAQRIVLLGLSDDTNWRYREDGMDPGTDWMSTTLDDSSWLQGLAVFDGKRGSTRTTITASGVQVPVRTQLNLTNANYNNFASDVPSYYFRTSFEFPCDPAQTELNLTTFFDDSGVVFLNGQEAWRLRVTNNASGLAFDLYAPAQPSSDAAFEGPFTLPLTNVVTGNNKLAVCLKQVNATSTDITMGISLVATVTNFAAVVTGPRLTIVNNGNGTARISWDPATGTLQEATNLGTWSDSSDQGNGTPRAISGRKFYRVR